MGLALVAWAQACSESELEEQLEQVRELEARKKVKAQAQRVLEPKELMVLAGPKLPEPLPPLDNSRCRPRTAGSPFPSVRQPQAMRLKA